MSDGPDHSTYAMTIQSSGNSIRLAGSLFVAGSAGCLLDPVNALKAVVIEYGARTRPWFYLLFSVQVVA